MFLVRHDSAVEEWADGMYIPRESLLLETVALSVTPADGDESPSDPGE